jgi:putative sugar O-methyltransferase
MKKYMKKFLKKILPPVIIDLGHKASEAANRRTNLKKWWANYDKKNLLPQKLKVMVDIYLSTSDYAQTSKYWRYLNILNISSIATDGIKNYRKTLSRNYFLFVDYTEEMVVNLLDNKDSLEKDLKISIDEIYKKHDGLSFLESIRHNTIVIALYREIKKLGLSQKIVLIRESRKYPFPALSIDGQEVSQDSLASLIEWNFINKAIKLDNISSVIEIGAGSGRTATCLLSINPRLKYVIVDIPPALFVSHEALSDSFPEKKIFTCPFFSDFLEIKKDYEEADIVFMMPSQMTLIPEKSIDLFLAIDCLHEMTHGHISYIFNQIDRLSKFFYMKCWNTTKVPFDNHILTRDSYPYNDNWQLLNRAKCIFPSNFFEAAFKMSNE